MVVIQHTNREIVMKKVYGIFALQDGQKRFLYGRVFTDENFARNLAEILQKNSDKYHLQSTYVVQELKVS